MKRKVILSILSLLALSACNGANETPFDNKWEVIQLSDIEYTLDKRESDNKNVLIINKYIGNKTNIEIPSSFKIDGIEYLVTSIGFEAFAYNYLIGTSISSIYIPSSVKYIYGRSFMGQGQLVIYCEASLKPSELQDYCNRPVYWGVKKEDIIIQDGVVYLIVNDWMAIVTQFIGSSDAKNISMQSKITRKRHEYRVTSIGKEAFYNCDLRSIVIPNNVINIESDSFYDCGYLASIVIPDSVLSIGRMAFYKIGESIPEKETETTFYCKAVTQPAGWDDYWNADGNTVYWKGEWSYVDGVPTPNKN